MKRTILLLTFLCGIAGFVSRAQQNPLSTQFMTNPFILNPAVAGTQNYFQVMSNHRFQWVGFTDAPITNSLSVFGPVVKYPMGWGATIAYDVTGPVSMGSVHGSYAYILNLNDNMNLSMGLNLGIMQYKIDFTKIDMEFTDPLMNSKENYYLPDANLGFYFYSTSYYAGIVVTHLMNSRIRIGTDPTGSSKLKSHFYLTGGYKYYFNRDWSVEPNLVLKKVWPAPFQLDVNARVWYQNMIWGGISYRTQEAISILLGYIWDRKIYIGYSYDLVLNPLGAHNLGSHELMLGYRFNDIKD
ncbi:MAG: type IX secretion system membrane protein PorP/SprF [Bacteroidales bacterium]|nr:type IX secretion system membrane protein PorP/SprF [Bacteroidales bacterium]